MKILKDLLKKLVGKKMVGMYHFLLAWLAALVYGFPSENLIVIGVTGTNGKSTTVNLIAKILEEARHKVIATSTVNFKIGNREWLNDKKMTMPGRFFLQRMLAEGLKQGCTHAVLEISSEGIEQFRHRGIKFDVCVFTNLTPEHIEAHGGFENYKQAKLKLFAQAKQAIVANIDDPYYAEFTNFKVPRVISFGKSEQAEVRGQNFSANPNGISFTVDQTEFNLKLRGVFDFYNALAAIATARSLGINLSDCKQALEKVSGIPGRMEVIDGPNFKVLVDYAPEPESLRQMYATIANWPKRRIIHVLGSTGGGRDISRRKILGEIADKSAHIVIVTNEDPYDDDPQSIIDDVASGAPKAIKILDRREAIAKALSLAQPNDLVLITGKGAEQKMAVKGGYIPWDDRQAVREELEHL
ncbi:MAG: UDP-N-acetylmuramoyl-L-alanyl-D-glutamate--2,6-diaminopimelate ligase [Candidatus Doudnabacteria bacterium]|nr:UDP-N-acetylmuramoyl-L-alanyl-D-glutamate--2,6-diaminopimelate ligase [Candidatus Doudnabacteria bacterium]